MQQNTNARKTCVLAVARTQNYFEYFDFALIDVEEAKCTATFYNTDDNGLPYIEKILKGRNWAFVVQAKENDKPFFPETMKQIICHRVHINADLTAKIEGFDQNEDYYCTDVFPIMKIFQHLRNSAKD